MTYSKLPSILLLTSTYPSVNGPSNHLFVRQQAEKVAELGHQIMIVAAYEKRIWPFSLYHINNHVPLWSTNPYEDHPGLDVTRMHIPILPKAYFSAHYGPLLGLIVNRYLHAAKRTRKFDLIHAHVANYAGFIAQWISKATSVPFMVTTHGADTDIAIHKSSAHRKAIQSCFQHAQRVVCVSRRIQDAVIEQGGRRDHCPIIRNGINVDDLECDTLWLKERFGNRTIILSVSHLLESKGLQYNLQALRHLIDSNKDVYYVIVGEGPYENSLRKLVRDLNIEGYVSFEGPKPHKEVMRYMSGCDIYSMPSWRESFGIVYMEAMLNGKPVIGCTTQGISDIVEHGINGILVPPHDVKAVVESIKCLIDQPNMAAEIGTKARQLVIRELTWNKSAFQLSNLYMEVLEEAHRLCNTVF